MQPQQAIHFSPVASRKASIESMSHTGNCTSQYKGNEEYFKTFKEEDFIDSVEMGSSFSSAPRAGFTVRTVGKLLDNNEVSIHESIGTFNSIEQSQNGSEYQGVLAKMGRSVDILNLPSTRQLLQKKPNATSNNFGKSLAVRH
jgi:hypothetical protein